MNPIDIVLMMLLAACFALALRRMLKRKTGCSCSAFDRGCGCSCCSAGKRKDKSGTETAREEGSDA